MNTIEEKAKAFFDKAHTEWGVIPDNDPKSLFDLMAKFAQAERGDILKLVVKFLEAQDLTIDEVNEGNVGWPTDINRKWAKEIRDFK